MEKFDFKRPEFLFCEIPIKNGTQNDDRIWIYSLESLSLIEFILVDDFVDFQFTGKQERFEYEDNEGYIENWFGVYVQNNCEATNNNPDEILKKAWKFLEDYLRWEDTNIEENS
ncbi:hypothetical protein [Flavobacterium capsici]|uniref:Uncharacterized protein n=1 Tax=Flavobacterium capsici TaxID=3075618 RepID=A0AA96EVE6_9FLAO|nr:MULTISPECIES: hypothetical protein [unclassified Flavobacterium]WNM19293.1 hypothetical protein RN608_01090 [Flavobacterium sp. PMR2A8]WNM20682.1 hypothetical protein RN605_08260 [Flavobacterium sp. PMTSA4]